MQLPRIFAARGILRQTPKLVNCQEKRCAAKFAKFVQNLWNLLKNANQFLVRMFKKAYKILKNASDFK